MQFIVSNCCFPVDSVFAMKQLPKEFGIELQIEFGTDYFWKTTVPQLMEGRTGGLSFHGPFVKIDFAFQSLDMLPEGFSVPEGREKPWGTAHAVLCCKEVVGEDNFAVINADDFYGREAYVEMVKVLSGDRTSRYAMAGYILDNTLTDNGSVARGVCEEKAHKLVSIVEHTKIARDGNKAVCTCTGEPHEIALDSLVSMNFFGFAPDVFTVFEKGFKKFLAANGGELKSEFFIPLALSGAMASGECSVDVFPTSAKWFGVTYAADKPGVVQKIKEMTEAGIYPDGLWKR